MSRRLGEILRKILKGPPLKFNPFVMSRVFYLWLFLGVAAGASAGIYWIVLEQIIYFASAVEDWKVIPLMGGAGLLAGLIIHWIGDPGEIQLIVNNIRFRGGRLDTKHNVSMILSSLLCVGTGGSLGPEAPLVQVTGSVGTWISERLRLKGEEFRSMTIAGMAAGFTALFGAPLGGSLFALEILHHRHVVEYYEAIIPAIVSSLAAYTVFALLIHLGFGPVWNVPAYTTQSVLDFGLAVVFGTVAAAVGWGFISVTNHLRVFVREISAPIFVKTCAGGFLLGAISFYMPLSRFFGHREIELLFQGNFTIGFLIALLMAKLGAIAITVTTGWRGGFIIPLFFMGAVLGLLLKQIFPSISLPLAAVCCMASLNSCVTRTPLSTTLLLSTMTGFSHFVPILFASMTGYFLAPKTPFIITQQRPAGET
ncbi:MAG TPA: chloride channel protein [Leptospiraceae bacterium]|nr:chloride channel protein [Leptospiraceae bacterium]